MTLRAFSRVIPPIATSGLRRQRPRPPHALKSRQPEKRRASYPSQTLAQPPRNPPHRDSAAITCASVCVEIPTTPPRRITESVPHASRLCPSRCVGQPPIFTLNTAFASSGDKVRLAPYAPHLQPCKHRQVGPVVHNEGKPHCGQIRSAIAAAFRNTVCGPALFVAVLQQA